MPDRTATTSSRPHDDDVTTAERLAWPIDGGATPASPTPEAVASEFLASLEKAVGPLQRSLNTLLTLSAGQLRSPTELCRGFKIAKMLAWRMWRLARARSGAEATKFVTGTTALESFLAAGARYGADKSLLDDVRQAYQDYQDFVRHTARDEATLRSMVDAVSGGESPLTSNTGRSAFELNRLRVGVQSTAMLCSFAFFPSELDGTYSAASAFAFADCWWVRPDTHAVFAQPMLTRESHTTPVHLSTPLDPELASRPEAEESLTPCLIRAFCRGDSTAVVRQRIDDMIVNVFSPLRMGANHATTLCFGEVKHACFLPLEQYPSSNFAAGTLVPSEHVTVEVYVHREAVRHGYVFRPFIADRLFWPQKLYNWAPRFDLNAMEGTFQVIDPTETFDSPVKVPPYREFLGYMFEQIKQARRDFYCYRVQVPTPPLGVVIGLAVGNDPGEFTTTRVYPSAQDD